MTVDRSTEESERKAWEEYHAKAVERHSKICMSSAGASVILLIIVYFGVPHIPKTRELILGVLGVVAVAALSLAYLIGKHAAKAKHHYEHLQ